MSTIRFLHTDSLRLGTPLSGLAESPTWLSQLATGATRQAVRNLIDAAVSRRAAFVLFAGDVTESPEDLAPALEWLNEQFQTLRSHNIRVVMTAGPNQTHAALRDVCDVVLGPTECLQVSVDAHGIHMSAISCDHVTDPDLIVEVGDVTSSPSHNLVYRAHPALQRSGGFEQVSHDGRLSLSAGVLQSTSQAERMACGALLLEADTAARHIRSEFVECDVIRFDTEVISLSSPATAEGLVSQVLDGSVTVSRSTTRTVVMDWVLTGTLTTDMSQIAQLGGGGLVETLREQLHSGHQGIWLRGVSFADATSIQAAIGAAPVVTEFVDRDLHGVQPYARKTYHRHAGDQGLAEELLAGLTFLSRVA